jgi:hypothetical protein
VSKKPSRYVSLRTLVHLVGAHLQAHGISVAAYDQNVCSIVADHTCLRAEKPGTISIRYSDSSQSAMVVTADLYTSPLNGQPAAAFPKKCAVLCLICPAHTTSVELFIAHLFGKAHLKSLKQDLCRGCGEAPRALLSLPRPESSSTLALTARTSGQIMCERKSGGDREDLYSVRPEGMSWKEVEEQFIRITCEPCGMSFVPQRCQQELLGGDAPQC